MGFDPVIATGSSDFKQNLRRCLEVLVSDSMTAPSVRVVQYTNTKTACIASCIFMYMLDS